MLRQNPARVTAHSAQQPPLAAEQPRYPLLILQPGLGPILPDYTTLAESLASAGYIVVGSTPTGSASVVVFQDGQVVYGLPQANLPDNATPQQAGRILSSLIQVWAADDAFLLDHMTTLAAADPAGRFTGRVNLAAVGVLGHSFGGAAAAQFCRRDARCQAGADLDGYLYGDVTQVGLRQPFLFLWSQPDNPGDAGWLRNQQEVSAVFQTLPPGSFQATLRGARHFNFSDYAVTYQPVVRLLGGLGSIDGAYGLRIAAAYLRAFFDQTLLGQPSPLLSANPPPFPEVRDIQRR